eukprot:741624-Prymnesium_polylepis.1
MAASSQTSNRSTRESAVGAAGAGLSCLRCRARSRGIVLLYGGLWRLQRTRVPAVFTHTFCGHMLLRSAGERGHDNFTPALELNAQSGWE